MSATVLSAIVNGAVLSVALIAVLLVVFRVTRFWNASTRYAVWGTVLLMTVGFPLAYVPVHWFQSLDEPDPAVVGLPTKLNLPEFEPGKTSANATPGPLKVVENAGRDAFTLIEIPAGRWTDWVLGAWALTSICMLLRLCVSYVWLHQRKTRALSAPVGIRAENWMKRWGSTRRIQVATSDEISSPVAAGPVRPLILIPARLLEDLRPEELEQIGLHEAAHFFRRDDYALLFQRLCEAIFAFHPVVRWIGARMDVEREIACDDLVVEVTGRARLYAACLTRVAAFANGHFASSLAAPAVETRSVLERRLDMLLDKNRIIGPKPLGVPVMVLLVLFAGVLSAISAGPQWVAFAAPPQERPGTTTSTNPIIVEPVPSTRSIAVTVPAPGQQPRAVVVPAQPQIPDAARADARDNLNRGVEAFRNRNFEVAVDYFGLATQLDPGSTVAELYLATAYASMYVPGPQGAGTTDYAYRAIQTFENVLRKEPANVDALVGLATVYQSRTDFRNARDNFLKASTLAPRNSSLFYVIGAVDWYLVYDKVNPPSLQEQTLLIDEGLTNLDKALALDPLYDEAMTYKNLLLREKAKLASDQTQRLALISQADEWFNKSLQARQQNAQSGRQRAPVSVAGLTIQSTPAPPPPPPPPAPGRVAIASNPQVSTSTATSLPLQRIGGDVAQANLVFQPKPVYPALARAARVQDYVMFQTTINKEGSVVDLKVLHGHPLLNDAAMDAVKQWRYKPQSLNGQPIDVITTVTVNFSFQ